MRLASTLGILVLALLADASHIACAQNFTSERLANCKRVTHKADFESRTDGPFVQRIGYSNALHSCIVVVVQGLPATRKRIEFSTEIVNAESRETIWRDTRVLRRGKEPLDRYPALDQEVLSLDIALTLPQA